MTPFHRSEKKKKEPHIFRVYTGYSPNANQPTKQRNNNNRKKEKKKRGKEPLYASPFPNVWH